MKFLLALALVLTGCTHIVTVHDQEVRAIEPQTLPGFKIVMTYPHEPKFKVGDCVAYFFVSESSNGNTGRVYMFPKAHVSDMKEKVVGIKGEYYDIENFHFGTDHIYHDTRLIESFDRDHAVLNCDGKYDDGDN